MKIRKLEIQNREKVVALLSIAYPKKNSHTKIINKLRENEKDILEWVCLHQNRVIGYIAFTNAYSYGSKKGYYLGTLAVNPDFQNNGVATQLLNFALRQSELREKPIFAIRNSEFFRRFGFEKCKLQNCSIPVRKDDFLTINNKIKEPLTISFEPEYFKK